MNNCTITNNSAQDNNHKPSNKNTYTRRIGSTTYIVTVKFSESGHETVEDKLLRLIKWEVDSLE